MAAAGLGAVASAKTAQEAEGVIKSILSALNHSIVHVEWKRDPKHYKKFRIESIELNLTAGIILGTTAIAVAWELIQNWIAAGAGTGELGNAATAAEILGGPAGWVTILVTDLLGNPVKDAQGNQKTVSVPPTFGAALNQALRNATVAGPGQAAQSLLNLVAAHTT